MRCPGSSPGAGIVPCWLERSGTWARTASWHAAEDALLVSSLEEGSDQLDSLCPPWSPHLRAPFSKWLFFPMVLIPNRDRYSKPPARSRSGHIRTSVSSSWDGKGPASVGEVFWGVAHAWLFGRSIQTSAGVPEGLSLR